MESLKKQKGPSRNGPSHFGPFGVSSRESSWRMQTQPFLLPEVDIGEREALKRQKPESIDSSLFSRALSPHVGTPDYADRELSHSDPRGG